MKRNDGLTTTERALIERLMDAIELDIAEYLSGIIARMDALEATVIAQEKRINRMAQAVGE